MDNLGRYDVPPDPPKNQPEHDPSLELPADTDNARLVRFSVTQKPSEPVEEIEEEALSAC